MARQTIQFGGKTWVRDGSWWVDAEALAPYGGDPDSAPPDVVEGNRVKYREGVIKQTNESRGNPGGGQKPFRNNLQSEYGKEQGNRIFDQHVAWAREAESMGASPKIVDYLYFQEGVLLPGGLVASYAGGNGQLVIEDLQGNVVPTTPELEQQARQKHVEVYGDKYGQASGGGYTNPQPPTSGTPTGGGVGPTAPQMPPAAPPPPITQPPGTAGTSRTPPAAGSETSPSPSTTRPPSPPATPPAPTPTPSGGRSPYPGLSQPPTGPTAPPTTNLSEQPGLGGSAAPAPAAATTGQASATTPPAPGSTPPGRTSGPVKPGLGAGSSGGAVGSGLGAPAQPPPGPGGVGAVAPPAAPPPARSPYPGVSTQPSPPQPAPQPAAQALSPYPGMHPATPPTPRTVSLPGTLAQFGVSLPQVAPGAHFFDPFTGQWK